MGQRLNIEITDGEYVLANCGYCGAACSETALDIAESIIRSYDELFSASGTDLYIALSLLELSGGGVTGIERKRIMDDRTGRFKGLEFASASGASEGFIGVTETGIRENRRLENGRLTLNLRDKTMDFHVHFYTYMEEYVDFTERVSGCIAWGELPQIDADADIFTGVYFDHLHMLRKIIEQCPFGFRLANGDVVEWM